jgi:hypothetical protein
MREKVRTLPTARQAIAGRGDGRGVIRDAQSWRPSRPETEERAMNRCTNRCTNRWTTSARAGAALLLLGLAGRADAQARGAALFDGKTLNGWKQVGAAHFTVQPDGSLRAEGGKGALYAAKPYRDFALELDFKVDGGGTDSGILLRADSARADAGYQVQIRQEPAGGPYERYQRMTGAIDGIAAPTHLVAKPVGEWNHARIEVAGQRYRCG